MKLNMCFDELVAIFDSRDASARDSVEHVLKCRRMVVNVLNIFVVDELCCILLTHVNVAHTARLSIVAKQVYVWMQEYVRVYSVAKTSWARIMWIEGWSTAQIRRINLEGYTDLLVRELFRSELVRCNKFGWYRFYRLTPCIKCGKMIAINWVHHCGRPQKRDYSSLLKDVKWAYIYNNPSGYEMPDLAFTSDLSSDRCYQFASLKNREVENI